MGRLRTAPEIFPELSDESLDATDGPSCSAVEALERQEPGQNILVSAANLPSFAGN